MRTRALLAIAVLVMVALAGCADAAGSISMDPVDDAELAERASRATAGADRYPAIDRQRLARTVIRNGTRTVTTPYPPLPSGTTYEHRGRYYEIGAERLGTVPGVATLLRIDYNATDPNGTRVAFADLSAADRRKIRPRLATEPRLRPGTDADVLLGYRQAAADDSVLLSYAPGPIVIAYEGEEYAIEADEPREGPLRTYRYEATLVAESTAAYARNLTSEYAFALSDLSDAEREVVEAARGDTYYAERTDDEAFAGVIDRLRRQEAVERDGSSGTWLVRYDGRRYWVEARFGAFAEGSARASTTPSVTPH